MHSTITMPLSGTSITGCPMFNYQLVIRPDTATLQGIQRLQEQLATGAMPAVDGLVLASFQAREAMEPTLLRWLQRIMSMHRSFQLSLQGFGALSSRILYLRVPEQQVLQQLGASLQVIDQYIRSCDCPPLQRSSHSYLPLTGPLPESLFELATTKGLAQSFQARFAVNELVLLRRQYEQEKGKQVQVFGLAPEPYHN